MREILFRGKTDSGKWVYGSLIMADDYCCILEKEEDVHPIDWPYLDGFIGTFDGTATPVKPETVSQWTGLVDKNGVKIFEGDIVVYKDGMATVQYNVTHASFLLLERSAVMGLRYFYLDEIITNTCNVIGNIWDNPELGVRDESE